MANTSSREPAREPGLDQLDALLTRLRRQMDQSQEELRQQVARLASSPEFAEVGKAVSKLGEVVAAFEQTNSKLASAQMLARPGARAEASHPRRPRGTPLAEFKEHVVSVLSECEGKTASPAKLARLVEEKYGDSFTEMDRSPLPNRPSVSRWRHYLSLAITQCREENKIQRDEDGNWTLVE